MVSSVTGQLLAPEELSPSYWATNLVSTVRFSAALTTCASLHSEHVAYLEVGPHSALQGPIKETLQNIGSGSFDYFHSCLRNQNDLEALLRTVGDMIVCGLTLDTARVNALETLEDTECKYQLGTLLTDLPGYTWDHSVSFWRESRLSRNLRSRQFPRHPLLGSRYLEDIPSQPSWRNLLMLKELPWLLKLRDAEDTNVPLTAMPPAVFVLMALEAASQMQIVRNSEATSLSLSDILFLDDMQLSLFTSPDTIIELHLNARSIGDGSTFEFDITSFATDESSLPVRHCIGKFAWSESPCKPPRLEDLAVEHNPLLLENMHLVCQSDIDCLKSIRVGSEASKGTFGFPEEPFPDFTIHPLVLNAVLQMPSISALTSILPSITRLSSIGLGVFPTRLPQFHSGLFAVQTDDSSTSELKNSIELFAEDCHISLSDVRFTPLSYDFHKPLSKSLFFKTTELPDISMVLNLGRTSLATCLDLLVHKWPMSDIGASGLCNNDASLILNLLSSQKGRSFRSLQMTGDIIGCSDDIIRQVTELNVSSPFHGLILDGEFSPAKVHDQLHPKGIACVRTSEYNDWKDGCQYFDRLCDIKGFSTDSWALYRKKAERPSIIGTRRPVKAFIHPDQQIFSTKIGSYKAVLPLRPEQVREFCQRSKKEGYDAVVLDSREQSVISTWAGSDLIPWLQDLLVYSKRIIWVTQRDSKNPFLDLAGNLLHTLQSEQPSLKVIWMIFDNTEDQMVIQNAIESACNGELGEDNEIQYEWKDSQVFIKRYLPDYELSAFTGATVPQMLRSPCNDKDYELAVLNRKESALLVSNPIRVQDKDSPIDTVAVEVVASVISAHDVRAYYDPTRTSSERSDLQFFAGRVASDRAIGFTLGMFVAGWHRTTHCKRVEVPPSQLFVSDASTSDPSLAVRLATICISLAIVDGFARARSGDKFKIGVLGNLGDSISHVVRDLDATTLDTDAVDNADFIIHTTDERGLLINQSPLKLEKYLASEHGLTMVSKYWKTTSLPISVRAHSLTNLKEAFESYQPEEPCCNVLIHKDIDHVKKKLAVYRKPERLFSKGTYIIVGGLGGLGRFACSWLASHGAKNLIAISRSGISSDEAQETFDAINSTATILEVIKADACNKPAISATFSKIRQRHSIKGVFNLAMLLGDAPLASMTGEEWDRALRLKIDSSWILHEETLQDDLELFILFSSIASVLGNRNQAGYNVGNTFLNALAAYRRSLGLCGMSIALGAMSKCPSFPIELPFNPASLLKLPRKLIPASSRHRHPPRPRPR